MCMFIYINTWDPAPETLNPKVEAPSIIKPKS